MNQTLIIDIEKTLGNLFRNSRKLSAKAWNFVPSDAELNRLKLRAGRAWRIHGTNTVVYIAKNIDDNNEVAIWMPTRNTEMLKEIANVVAGLRCYVSVRTTLNNSVVAIPDSVAQMSGAELAEYLEEIFLRTMPEC